MITFFKFLTMSTWVKDFVSFFQCVYMKILIYFIRKIGCVPNHVALIMDGNRRYARKLSVNISTGHSKGFEKLSEIMKWSLDLGISTITVYAFSIENFKRCKEEVDTLMDLFRDKFQNLLNEIDEMNRLGIRINVPGRLSLLPEDLQVLISRAMLATRHNNKMQLNIAYAYTGRDEICRAASHIVDSVKSKQLSLEDIDEDLVSQALDIKEPELLIRTSGEVRLSDFLLWQVSNSVLYFSDVLWPEFSAWDFLRALLHFKRYGSSTLLRKEINPIHQSFLNDMESRKWKELQKLVS